MDRRETERIVRAIREVRAAGEPAAIATVVRVRGSAYRREGTRILVRQDGPFECLCSGAVDIRIERLDDDAITARAPLTGLC
jgi:xanthine dehydrogenase accessory factor